MKISLLIIPILLIMVFFQLFKGTDKIKVNSNIPYYSGKNFNPEHHILDIYMPDSKEKTPVLIFIHGGIWRAGDKAMGPMENLGKVFAENGITVVQINYRLYPEVIFPEFVNDAANAVSWVYNNIENYNGDKNKIYLGGHSAGGHIAALVALDTSYLTALGINASVIKGIIPMEGAYDINLMFKDSGTANVWKLKDVFSNDEKIWKSASPVFYSKNCIAKVLLIHGSNDELTPKEQTDEFYKALKDNNKNAELYIAQGKDHFSIISKMKDGDDVVEKIVEFIK